MEYGKDVCQAAKGLGVTHLSFSLVTQRLDTLSFWAHPPLSMFWQSLPPRAKAAGQSLLFWEL